MTSTTQEEAISLAKLNLDADSKPSPQAAICDSKNADSLRIVTFTGALVDQSYSVQMWVLPSACIVWMGSDDQPPRMSSLSTAISTRYDRMPTATGLVGNSSLEEQQIAQRLALRTKRQCFVCCDLPDLPELVAYVEKQVIKRLSQELS